MKNTILMPMLASRESIALRCAIAPTAAQRRGIAARGAAWSADVLGDAAKRVRTTGKHTGFARNAGSLPWSPST